MMADSEATVFDSGKAEAGYLEDAVRVLGKAGVRLAFPEHVEVAQTMWPEDCPLSDQELRAELGGLLAEIEKLTARARVLHDRLPDPPELQNEYPDEVPASLYLTLYSALCYLFQEGLTESGRVIGEALAATPEGIREAWLKRQLSNKSLQPLIPGAGE